MRDVGNFLTSRPSRVLFDRAVSSSSSRCPSSQKRSIATNVVINQTTDRDRVYNRNFRHELRTFDPFAAVGVEESSTPTAAKGSNEAESPENVTPATKRKKRVDSLPYPGERRGALPGSNTLLFASNNTSIYEKPRRKINLTDDVIWNRNDAFHYLQSFHKFVADACGCRAPGNRAAVKRSMLFSCEDLELSLLEDKLRAMASNGEMIGYVGSGGKPGIDGDELLAAEEEPIRWTRPLDPLIAVTRAECPVLHYTAKMRRRLSRKMLLIKKGALSATDSDRAQINARRAVSKLSRCESMAQRILFSSKRLRRQYGVSEVLTCRTCHKRDRCPKFKTAAPPTPSQASVGDVVKVLFGYTQYVRVFLVDGGQTWLPLPLEILKGGEVLRGLDKHVMYKERGTRRQGVCVWGGVSGAGGRDGN